MGVLILSADSPVNRVLPMTFTNQSDCAFPSATQNEITAKDAANLIKNGIKLLAEGANMPSTLEATKMFLDAKILYGPAKAANAGGVATSGLEMAQNSTAELDARGSG